MKNTQKMYRQGTGLKFVIFGLVPYGSARKHVKLIRNSQKMMKFGGKNCKNTNEKLTNI